MGGPAPPGPRDRPPRCPPPPSPPTRASGRHARRRTRRRARPRHDRWPTRGAAAGAPGVRWRPSSTVRTECGRPSRPARGAGAPAGAAPVAPSARSTLGPHQRGGSKPGPGGSSSALFGLKAADTHCCNQQCRCFLLLRSPLPTPAPSGTQRQTQRNWLALLLPRFPTSTAATCSGHPPTSLR